MKIRLKPYPFYRMISKSMHISVLLGGGGDGVDHFLRKLAFSTNRVVNSTELNRLTGVHIGVSKKNKIKGNTKMLLFYKIQLKVIENVFYI